MSQLAPWTNDGIDINYPVWAAWRLANPRWSALSPEGRPPCMYSLQRSTLAADLPAGWPADRGDVLVEVLGVHGVTPAVIEALWWPGCGYYLSVSVLDAKPARRLSEAAKQGIRRKALVRRIEKAAPLFAADLIPAELEKQPDYYGVK